MTDFISEALPMYTYLGNGDVVVGTYNTTVHDRSMMRLTLDEAEAAGEQGDNAVACTLVLPGGEIATAQTREFRDNDLDAHAESLAYSMVQPLVGRSLGDVTAYCSAEPCYGCAYRFDKGSLGLLFIGASKTDAPDFFRNSDTLDRIWSTTRRQLSVVKGLQTARAVEILARYSKLH